MTDMYTTTYRLYPTRGYKTQIRVTIFTVYFTVLRYVSTCTVYLTRDNLEKKKIFVEIETSSRALI